MSAIQAADEPGQAALRTGVLVGFGLIAKGHIEGYRRLGRMGIGAVVDITMARRHAAETELGLPPRSTSSIFVRPRRVTWT